MPKEAYEIISQSEAAEFLTQASGITVSRLDIAKWLRGKALPEGAQPFPRPTKLTDHGHRWRKKKPLLEWFNDNIKPKENSNGHVQQDLFARSKQADMERKVHLAEQERIRTEAAQRSMDGNYVLWRDAVNWAAGIGNEVNQSLNMIEDILPGRIVALQEHNELAIKTVCCEVVSEVKKALLAKQNERPRV